MKDFGLHLGVRRTLPVIRQAEAAECGLACLAMIASYHGHLIDLPALRQRFSLSLKGLGLAHLMTFASCLGMEGRPLRVDLEYLGEMDTPCILHWDMTHFVVLKKVTKTHLLIHDPAMGFRKLTFAEASSHFTGVVLEVVITAGFEFKNETRRVTLSDLTGRVVGLKKAVFYLFALAIVLELVTIVFPFFLQWVVDAVIVNGDHALLVTLGLGFMLLVLMQSLISGIRSWTTLYFGTTLNIQWFSNLFTHLLRLPIGFFEKRYLGDLISRFDSVQVIQQSLSANAVETLVDGLVAVLMLTVMFIYSSMLASIVVLSLGAYALLRVIAYEPSRNATEEYILRLAKQQGYFIETVRGIQPLKMFHRETQRKATWLNLAVSATNAKLKADKLSIFVKSANLAIFGLQSVIVVWLAAKLVMSGHFSIGMLFAFVAYKEQFNTRVTAFIDRLFDLRLLSVQAERLGDIVLATPEPVQDHAPWLPKENVPALEMRSMSFRYADTDPWVLQDVNLQVMPGECIAITGRSGAGKSTLVKLISGLLQPQSGEVMVQGLRTHQHRSESTSTIGFVMQEDSLFSGTIRENIHFFDDLPKPELVTECAVLACIHDDIMGMPMGYDTLVGDMGTTLSGGQKQRLLIARALYRNPSILVLDEATSHLDVETEALIAQTLQAFKLTRIIVAHRPQTIAIADRVLSVQDGGYVVQTHPKHISEKSVGTEKNGRF